MAHAAGLRCCDWRSADAAVVAPLIEAEVRAWRETLAWDVAESWSVVEPARRAGRLPGLIAVDAQGRPAGWTAYLAHRRYLQVMAFVAADPAVARTLLDGVVSCPEARQCHCTIFSVRDVTPALPTLLSERGFILDRHRYLIRDLDRGAAPPAPVARWRDCDDAMAMLCREAYSHVPGVRAFAPGGTLDEWRHYVATLVTGNGCGWFLPELSGVVPLQPSAGPVAGLDAALMLTDLGGGVAHIAQLAVRPAAQRRGLARTLVEAAVIDAARFFDRITLMVSGENAAAWRLYTSAGFRLHAPFIVARLDHQSG